MNTIPIVEIFGPTLQGEGPNAGARCMFVRVKGCDFSCDFCDSKFTWNSEQSWKQDFSIYDLSITLLRRCRESNCKRVILTGGNPCLYNFTQVLLNLNGEGIKVDVETQGSLFPLWLAYIDTIVFSPKPPSSGMPDTYDKIVKYLNGDVSKSAKIAIKIPVFNDEDIEFARRYAKFVNEYLKCDPERPKPDVKMYLSVGNSDVTTTESIRDRVLSDYEKLLNKINEFPEHFENIYILPQIHTLIWGNKQGV